MVKNNFNIIIIMISLKLFIDSNLIYHIFPHIVSKNVIMFKVIINYRHFIFSLKVIVSNLMNGMGFLNLHLIAK